MLAVVELCLWCREPITDQAQIEVIPHIACDGTAELRQWHKECLTRSIIGGVNHLRHTCTCCGGTDPPDPPNLTRREAAIAACAYYKGRYEETTRLDLV